MKIKYDIIAILELFILFPIILVLVVFKVTATSVASVTKSLFIEAKRIIMDQLTEKEM